MLKHRIQMDTEISSSIKAKLDLQDEISYVNQTINSKSETLAQIINAVGTDLDAEKQRSQGKDMVLMNQGSCSIALIVNVPTFQQVDRLLQTVSH